MKTLREISDQEQIEAIAADPHAEINLRILAKDHLAARRRHDEFTRHMERQARIAKVLFFIVFYGTWAAALAVLIWKDWK